MNQQNYSSFLSQTIADTPLLSKEQENRLSKDVLKSSKAKAQKAINTLVQSNIRLAIRIISDEYNWFNDKEDLLSEALLGLHKAASRYDSTHGTRFSTYASWYIRQHIIRYIKKHSLVPMSYSTNGTYYRIQKIATKLAQDLGYEPSPEELSEITGINVTRIEQLLSYNFSYIPLDTPIARDETVTTFADIIKDPAAIQPDEAAEYSIEQVEIEKFFEGLTPRQTLILKKRFGFQQEEPITLEEIGKILNITRERTRQIQEQALQKIRKNLKQKDIRNGNICLQVF